LSILTSLSEGADELRDEVGILHVPFEPAIYTKGAAVLIALNGFGGETKNIFIYIYTYHIEAYFESRWLALERRS